MEPGDQSLDEALDPLLAEAEAGRSDAWLAKKAFVSVSEVRRWKRRRGLSGKPPRVEGPVQEAISALQGLAEGYQGPAHQTAESLDWEAPQFVLRRPLDYTQYARAAFVLVTVAQFSERQVARATGTREHDVVLALQAWRRHLVGYGRRCLGCAALCDPRFNEFCSRSCHDHATKPEPPLRDGVDFPDAD